MPANRQAEVTAAAADIDFSKKTYQLEFDTTEGKILVDFWPEVAPGHVKNMLGLAKIGFYDGVGFHRIIRGFMIQGGCPLGTGTGDAGYKITAEFNKEPHVAGVLSMARSGDPNSAGCQFFICLDKHSHLDNQYTAFGKTADDASLAVVNKIGNLPVGPNDKPKSPVKINKATVIEKAM